MNPAAYFVEIGVQICYTVYKRASSKLEKTKDECNNFDGVNNNLDYIFGLRGRHPMDKNDKGALMNGDNKPREDELADALEERCGIMD